MTYIYNQRVIIFKKTRLFLTTMLFVIAMATSFWTYAKLTDLDAEIRTDIAGYYNE